ncbi:hypothetical protein SUGI_0722860 [Cryptomeria japonica]|nr:hypothetical protein SUGI_0722860 [Cryptomeria japonica]
MGNLMKTNEEKPGKDSHEHIKDFCARNEEESNLKVDFAAKEEASIDCLSPCSEEFQSWSISNETGEEDTHSATMQLESNSFSFTAAGFKGLGLSYGTYHMSDVGGFSGQLSEDGQYPEFNI